jgi:HEAT repeat protein/beta-lactamase regulating signal transducer with metallopeptidase domain
MALSPDTVTLMFDAAWRVSLVLGAAWLATRALGRRPAALRHAVWAAALVAALAVPMLAGVVPSWRLAILPAPPPAAAVTPAPPVVPASRPLPAALPPRTAERVAAGAAALDIAADTGSARERLPAGVWLGLLWASVAAVILGRYLASVASVRWLTRDADPVLDRRWRDAAEVASAELGLREPPALLASAHVTVPFTSGLVRPVIVVPAGALATWSDERVRVVLLHELAHVRRRDCLVQALSQVACAAYWFNPLAWMAARRLRAERERACDDLVLDAGLRGADYAQHLLDIARTVTPRRSLSAAALAMARPSELEGRLLAILDGPRARRTPGTRVSWRAAMLAVAVVLPVASVQPVAREALAADAGAPDAAAPVDVAAALAQPAPAPSPTPTPTPTPTPRAPVTREEAVQAGAIVSRVAGAVIAKTGLVGESVVDAVAEGIAAGVAGGLHAVVAQAGTPAPADPEARQARPVSPAVIQGLTEAMKDSDPDVRKQAMQALSRLGAPIAYDTLAASLKDEDEDVRETAAFLIGRTRDPRSVPLLIGMLKDPEPDVRQQAAFALAQMKAAQAVPNLIAALKDEDEDVRRTAIFGLMQIGDRTAGSAYVEALKDPSEDVREQAVFALTRLGDRSAVPAFTRLLAGDESEDVRQQAAFALSQLGDESVVPALTAALKDPSADVRRQAVFALSQIAGGDEERAERRGPRAVVKAPAPAAKPSTAPAQVPAPAPPPQAKPVPPR